MEQQQAFRISGVPPIFGKAKFVTVGRRKACEPLVVIVLGVDERRRWAGRADVSSEYFERRSS